MTYVEAVASKLLAALAKPTGAEHLAVAAALAAVEAVIAEVIETCAKKAGDDVVIRHGESDATKAWIAGRQSGVEVAVARVRSLLTREADRG